MLFFFIFTTGDNTYFMFRDDEFLVAIVVHDLPCSVWVCVRPSWLPTDRSRRKCYTCVCRHSNRAANGSSCGFPVPFSICNSRYSTRSASSPMHKYAHELKNKKISTELTRNSLRDVGRLRAGGNLTLVDKFVGFDWCMWALLWAIRSSSFRKSLFSHVSHAFVPFSIGCLPPSIAADLDAEYVGDAHTAELFDGDCPRRPRLRWLKICARQTRKSL